MTTVSFNAPFTKRFEVILSKPFVHLVAHSIYRNNYYISDFGGKSPDREGGQVGLCRTEYFLSDKDTTCSVRLNRESTSGGLLRDVSGVLLSVGRYSKLSIGSDFAKICP